MSGQAAQVRLVADSYGLDSGRRSRLLDAIIERQLRNETFWASHCASELPSLLTREKMREMVDWSVREAAFTRANQTQFEAALR